jgi:DnaK suppressor protein
MTKKQMEELREELIKMKTDILNGGLQTKKEDLHVSSDDLADEGDLANSVVEQQVTFSMRQRELDKLRLTDQALHRMEEGNYGECEDCGEPIGFKRLKNQPFAELCITHAEEQERKNSRFLRHG